MDNIGIYLGINKIEFYEGILFWYIDIMWSTGIHG